MRYREPRRRRPFAPRPFDRFDQRSRLERLTDRPRLLSVVAVLVLGTSVVGASVLFGGGDPDPVTGGTPPSPTVEPTPTPVPTPVPIPGHEVFGFLPYWEMIDGVSEHLEQTSLTTLALFSVTHRPSGALRTNQTGYERITGDIGKRLIREAHKRGVRVELVHSSFGTDKNAAFYGDLDAQARTIRELVDLVDSLKLDGVNVDTELLPTHLVQAYGAFVGRLRAAVRDGNPDRQVSVATQANSSGAAMAVAATNAGVDRIFLMGYDYHWKGSAPGASAPLDRRDGDEKDLVWSLELYERLGVPVQRTLLGLPLYGIVWPTASGELGAPNTGRGESWIPARNLEFITDPGRIPELDPIEVVDFHAFESEDGWIAIYVDSVRTLAPKLRLANERGLAGAGFWALGYERGITAITELIGTFHAGELGAP